MALFLAGLRSVDPDSSRRRRSTARAFPHLSQSDHADDRADLHRGHRGAAAIRDQDLRSRRRADRGGPGISTTFPATYVYDLMFQRGQIAIGAAAAIMMLARSPSCSFPMRCGRLALQPGGRPWLTRPSTARSTPQASRAPRGARPGTRRRLCFPDRVRAHLSPAAVRRRRQFVSRIAGDHQNGLIALPHSFSLKAWPQAWRIIASRAPAKACNAISSIRWT
jgi:hypothetical protein